MTTLALSTLRDRLRILLADTSSKIWDTDSDLNLFLNLAIIEFTSDIPIPSVQTYTIASDQQTDAHTYLLPSGFVTDEFVRGYFESSSQEENIPEANMQYGAWEENDEPRCYIVDWPQDGYLYLPREPQGTTFALYYGAYWTTWLTEDTDTFNLGRKRWGEQAVYAYAAYLAFNPSSARRAQLEQWSRKGDQNVGNPLEEEAARWLNRYYSLLDRHGEQPESYEFTRAGKS